MATPSSRVRARRHMAANQPAAAVRCRVERERAVRDDKMRNAERSRGARRSANVRQLWPANDAHNATSQPPTLASAGASVARSTSDTATAQCTAAAAAPTATKVAGRRQHFTAGRPDERTPPYRDLR